MKIRCFGRQQTVLAMRYAYSIRRGLFGGVLLLRRDGFGVDHEHGLGLGRYVDGAWQLVLMRLHGRPASEIGRVCELSCLRSGWSQQSHVLMRCVYVIKGVEFSSW